MIEKIIKNTDNFIKSMSKVERKKIGQFFTSPLVARFMASLFAIPYKPNLTVLDAGAGSGILSAALMERLDSREHVERVDLTCYEIDEKVLPLLETTLNYLKEHVHFELVFHICRENYILAQELAFNGMGEPSLYDLSIGNPPYKKVGRNAYEALAMPDVCHGAPNLYFLFMAMSLFNLSEGGEMVYIVPRSWTSGAYFKAFREYLLSHGSIELLHLFSSRDRVFSSESVLQETIIIKVSKKSQSPFIEITSSADNSFECLHRITLPSDNVIYGVNKYVYLITTPEEEQMLKAVQKLRYTLPDLGLRVKTGLTVDFREREYVLNQHEDDAVPMFFAQHIQNGSVSHPIGKSGEWLRKGKSSLLQKNSNYLFVKRFTSKEEQCRLQCGIYLSSSFPSYDLISTQNKMNFIDNDTHDLSKETVCGLYVLFNSTIYDRCYRILNGSTQVNSTEVNTMPIPSIEIIDRMGRELLRNNDLSTKFCDHILDVNLQKD